MFPVTERHGYLPERAEITNGSKGSDWQRLDARVASVVLSHACHASVAEQSSARLTCDNELPVQASRDNGLETTLLPALVREQTKHANRSGVPNGSGLRAQALAELLASIAEYRAASPAFRHYWRVLALHDIARFKRDWFQPERAAFEAAVERSKQRRRAA